MAHSTAIPAAQQTPKTRFDWYTFLRNAFLNGLKAYGACFMAGVGAPGPSHLGTWENSTKAQKASFRAQPVALSPPALALPHTPFAEPAWRNA